MIRKRAELNMIDPPGQINRYTHGPARPSRGPTRHQKLGDYIDKVIEAEERTARLNEPKMSFDEWWIASTLVWKDSAPKHWFESVWNIAYQEGLKEGILSNQSEGYKEV